MRFGMYSLPTYYAEQDGSLQDFYQKLLFFMEQSEAVGFDSVWVNEHHFHPYGGMIPQPPVLLAMIAGRTRKVRLGTSVAVLPLHHPLALAESYAMVDHLSGGRLEFGFGSGFAAYDHEVMGASFAERQERSEEVLDIILKAWRDHPFSHQGPGFRFDQVDVWPSPLQSPHPPIWSSATRNPQTFSQIGARGFNLLTVAYVKPLEELARLIAIWRESARQHGHDSDRLHVSTHFQIYVDEDGATARRTAEEAIQSYLAMNRAAKTLARDLASMPREELSIENILAEGRALAGTPDEVAAQLSVAIAELGLTQVDCTFFFGGIPFERAVRSFELFSGEVMPRFKRPSEGGA